MNWAWLVNMALLAQTCFLVGVSAMVMLRYYRTAYRQHPRLFKHVAAIALSYIIFQLRGVWAIYASIVGLNDGWLYMLLMAAALGDYALLKVARRQSNPRHPNGRIHATEERAS